VGYQGPGGAQGAQGNVGPTGPPSDSRLKTDVQEMSGSIEKINQVYIYVIRMILLFIIN
jgi:hypothetical protein